MRTPSVIRSSWRPPSRGRSAPGPPSRTLRSLSWRDALTTSATCRDQNGPTWPPP
ncbi:unnamed protein product [Staurois parvus]|uniref:Uncharacterized protein n=1 Tax=Staurois parvus TaxID=386267 RepID=A0ABN9EDV2_9NEOB|nr:unnamed protein product [Staurois parvus]